VAPFYLDTLYMAKIQIAPSPKHSTDRQKDIRTDKVQSVVRPPTWTAAQ